MTITKAEPHQLIENLDHDTLNNNNYVLPCPYCPPLACRGIILDNALENIIKLEIDSINKFVKIYNQMNENIRNSNVIEYTKKIGQLNILNKILNNYYTRRIDCQLSIF